VKVLTTFLVTRLKFLTEDRAGLAGIAGPVGIGEWAPIIPIPGIRNILPGFCTQPHRLLGNDAKWVK
jgi:hypothetical protein